VPSVVLPFVSALTNRAACGALIPMRYPFGPREVRRSVPRLLVLFVVGLLPVFGQLRADVRMPGLFSDNMVLQQGVPLRVWGWANPDEQVTVEFRKQKAAVTTGADGRWSVALRAERAGGPDSLIVTGAKRLEINNVLVGEVWVCSGQSNMEWPLSRAFEPAADIAAAEIPQIRLFTVPKKKAVAPVDDVAAQWVLCSPSTVPNFSAVAFYFGRALRQARHVPVGLIHTSWGGSPAEVWMSQEALGANEAYRRDILDTYTQVKANYDRTLAQWEQDKAEAEKAGRAFQKGRPGQPWCPTELYNGMIAPLLPFPICGAIWYQGESNAGRAWQYRTLFADMIRNWRQAWGQGNFTFLAVQLAPWDRNKKRPIEEITAEPVESDWAELREAQVIVSQTLPKVGVVVITDVGDKDDIHPTKKAPVGERLALAAQVIAYREKIAGLSPVYKRVRFSDDSATVTFDRVGQGLEARGGDLTGFAVAGSDRKFVWAKAEIKGRNRVVVSSPSVPAPVAVRFGWADCPVVNLFSKAGLPASPFRTDDFPMVSAPKKP